MGSYSQWAAGTRKARCLWVCGPEHVLATEVVAAMRQRFGQGDTLFPGADAEPDIWADVMRCPLAGSSRLLVVYDAHLLEDGDALAAAVAALADMPSAALVFVTLQDCYASKVRGEAKKLLAAPAAVQAVSYGQVVRCVLPPEGKAAWVARRLAVPETLAWELLNTCGGDLPAASAVCGKLAAAGEPPARETFALLAERPAADRFTEALLASDRIGALAAVPALDSLGRAIGLLASRLDMLAQLHSLVRQDKTAKEIAERAGNWVLPYRAISRSYDEQRVRSRRSLLAAADSAWRSGARDGVAELLVALW